jgi:predicted DNA-binding transcriptional regulator YafY
MPQIKHAQIRFRVIDRCLRNTLRPYPSKSDLREACEEALYGSTDGANICDSTIEKDLFNMRMDHDAPIKYSKRHDGYYYEDDSYSINDIPLSEEDLESIRFAAYTLSQFREVDLFRQFGSAIDKIVNRVAVSADQSGEMDQFVQFETAYSTGGQEWLPILLTAVKQKSVVTFEYGSFRSGIRKTRKVLPLFLKEYRNRWYAVCQDLEKSTIITFALDRMHQPVVLHDAKSPNVTFDANAYFRFATGISVVNEARSEQIIIKANTVASRYLESQPLHWTQQVLTDEGDSKTFSMEVIVSEELIREILAYGGEICVEQPSSLRQLVKSRIGEMKKVYGM